VRSAVLSSRHSLFNLAALFYFQQVNGERPRGAVQRPKFRNSPIS
jgi:hypothetical protein